MPINWSWKKVLSSSALALLATTCVYAIPKGPCEPKPSKDICCEEPKPGPFAFAYPKDMNLACPSDFYFYGEYLLMQPMEDGLEYGIRDTNGPNSTAPELAGGNVLSFSSGRDEYDFDSGFRIGLGTNLDHDAWTIGLQWTWYKSNQDVSASEVNSSVIIPQWIPGNTQAPATGDTRASQRWTVKVNAFDFTLAKPFHVSRYFTLSPFTGIRATWIDQNYLPRYGGNFATEMDSDNNFWGVGSRFGVDSEWLMGSGFQLLSSISTSLLYGKFHVTQNLPFGDNTFALSHDFYKLVSNLETKFGIGWGMHFNDMQNHVRLQAMWEFHNWNDQNQLRKVITNNVSGQYVNDTISRGDLSLSGVSFRVVFDF